MSDQRIRLPADVLEDGLDAAVNEEEISSKLLRATMAVCLDGACGSRGDTGVGIRNGDVRLRSDRGIVVRLRYQKGDVKRDETTGKERVVVFEPDSVVGLYEGLARWELRKRELGMMDGVERSYWALPGETRTLHWKQSKMNDMLVLFLGAHGVVAPDGFAYTYHSLRHMAASSMKAIGLSDRHIMAAGRWKALESIETYIDPYCKATGGCYRFFGYLLPPVDRLASQARKPSDMRQW